MPREIVKNILKSQTVRWELHLFFFFFFLFDSLMTFWTTTTTTKFKKNVYFKNNKSFFFMVLIPIRVEKKRERERKTFVHRCKSIISYSSFSSSALLFKYLIIVMTITNKNKYQRTIYSIIEKERKKEQTTKLT